MTSTNVRQPLFQISKRTEHKKGLGPLVNLAAVFTALVIGGIFVACLGYDPFKFYIKVFAGCFESPIYIKLLIRTIVPLLITSIGLSVAFKMKFWNIGAEGQILMGALCSFTMALLLKDSVPSFLGILLVLISGTLGGGLYGLIVAAFKAKFNTNETLLTLMFNYIALYIVFYLLNNNVKFFIAEGNGIPTFKIISNALWLSEIKIGSFSFDTSLFIAIIVVVFVAIYLKFTKQGYQINVVGDSPNTARYAGMKVKRIMLRTMFLSSAIIGLVGALQITGSAASHTMSTGITNGVGWTAIIVAWLAKLNPVAIVVVSILMGILEQGSNVARSAMGISAAMADVLQGLILFTILAFDFFINYKVTLRKKFALKEETAVATSEDAENQTKTNEDNSTTTSGSESPITTNEIVKNNIDTSQLGDIEVVEKDISKNNDKGGKE